MDERQRELIEARRASARERLAALAKDYEVIVESSRSVSTDDEHDPEGSTIAFERAQVDALMAQTVRQITELDEALDRIDAGTYGVCSRCGEPIARERLEVRPSADTCRPCGER